MPKLNTEALVASVKSRTLAPTSQKTWSDNELISILNEELFLGLVPDIQKAKEDFFKTSKRVPVVAGQTTWRMPERALGTSLEDVVMIDNNNNRFPLSRLNSRDIQTQVIAYPTYFGFIIEDDSVRLIPQLNQVNNVVEFRYARRLSKLVPTDRVCRVTALTPSGLNTIVDVDTDLTAILSSGDKTDIYPSVAPFSLLFEDVDTITVTSTQITYLTSDVTNSDGAYTIKVGDYISLPQESNLLMLPEEFDPILAQQAAIYLLEALGDQNKIQLAYAKLEKMRKAAFSLIANRVEFAIEHIRQRASFRRFNKYGVFSGD